METDICSPLLCTKRIDISGVFTIYQYQSVFDRCIFNIVPQKSFLTMKQIFFLFILGSLGTSLWGQGGVRAGIKLGAGLAGQQFDLEKTEDDYFFTNKVILGKKSESVPAFHVAGFAELDVHKHIGFGAALSVANRGHRLNLGDRFDFERASVSFIYAQIPAYVQARASGFFLNIGPYLGLALGGDIRLKLQKEETLNDPIVWGNDFSADFRRLDVGLRLEAGGSYRNVRFFAGSDIGLLNLMPMALISEIPGISLRNRAFYGGMGYVFSALK